MSVYGHLSKFNNAIGKFVKEKQYKDKSFAQTIYLEPGTFPIKKGELIGYSGNTGGSGGPHLHYEIRYADSQDPVNPLYFGLDLNDGVNPIVKGLAVYPYDNEAVINGCDTAAFFSVNGENGKYSAKDVFANGKLSFGISSYDQAEGAANKNGVYSVELLADSDTIFRIVSDRFSYSETRYVNSLIDYAHWIRCEERFMRTEKDPFNELKIYEKNKSYVIVNEDDTLNMRYILKDYSGNKSVLKFKVIGCKPPMYRPKEEYGRSYYRVFNGSATTVGLDGFVFEIPKLAFYRDVYLKTEQIDGLENIASDYAYLVGNKETPVHNSITVKIRPKEKFANDKRLFVATLNDAGHFVSQGGKLVDGMVQAKTRSLGTFVLAVDSIAPEIKPINFNDGSKIIKCKQLRIKIKDNAFGTGINTYALYINNVWVLAEYDAKNCLLFYDVDNHLKQGKNTMKCVVTDNVGNKTSKEWTLNVANQ